MDIGSRHNTKHFITLPNIPEQVEDLSENNITSDLKQEKHSDCSTLNSSAASSIQSEISELEKDEDILIVKSTEAPDDYVRLDEMMTNLETIRLTLISGVDICVSCYLL